MRICGPVNVLVDIYNYCRRVGPDTMVVEVVIPVPAAYIPVVVMCVVVIVPVIMIPVVVVPVVGAPWTPPIGVISPVPG